ncbi:transcriptional protein SWT1 [Aphidius gifuensis]|uniref:transcriptional protein SWT1 n=1 Tax=Aphidius gifuensis TaxID=684658 RepID=UPI001CDCCA63|nr:transcriptional protein SWT1 [Aphidius gifuensis]
MDKAKLPENWIVKQSKNYPDHVYYFNVKTHKTTWVNPNKAADDEHVNEDDEDTEPPSSPPLVTTSTPNRPKLRAKRQLSSSSSSVDETVNKKSNDTPQMIALRKKLAEKQSKTTKNPMKKSKITMDLKTNDKKIDKVLEKNDEKIIKNNSRQSLTPQMKLMQEKLDARRSLQIKNNKKQTVVPVESPSIKKTIPEPENNQRTTRLRSRSLLPIINKSPDKNSETTETSKKTALKRPRDDSDDDEETEKNYPINNTKITRKSLPQVEKKTKANDRLKRLRKSLNEEINEMDTTDAAEKSKDSIKLKDHEKIMNTKPASVEKNGLQRIREQAKNQQNESRKELQLKKASKYDEDNLQASGSMDPKLETIVESPDIYYEKMDWEPVEDEEIITEVEAVRNELGTEETDIHMNDIIENSLDLTDGTTNNLHEKKLYIVIDTNVYLSSLSTITSARDAEFRNYGRPIVVVPWTVLRELDYIKDDKKNTRSETLKYKARQAVSFLNKHFSHKHPRILGQTPNDVANNRQKFSTSCPDDEILQTCLQIREKNNCVVLLSYDKNLCNKAMIHDIVTLGKNDPLEKIDYINICDAQDESLLSASLNNSYNERLDVTITAIQKELILAGEIYDEIQEILTEFLTVIVTNELKNLYNHHWEKYVLIKPPWTINTVLKCAIKHWIAAVNESFIRKGENIIKELYDIVTKLECKKLNDVEYFIELVWKLMQCLQEKKYPNFLINISKKIDEIRDKCKDACAKINQQILIEEIGYEKDEDKAENRANAAFQHFEKVYQYARDICGAACENMEMPCSIPYQQLNPPLSPVEIRYRQPEVAAQIVRLLHILGTALEDVKGLNPAHNSVMSLYHALESFYSIALEGNNDVITPLDVYCCLTRREKNLRAGIKQLSDLSLHFSRMPSYKCK